MLYNLLKECDPREIISLYIDQWNQMNKYRKKMIKPFEHSKVIQNVNYLMNRKSSFSADWKHLTDFLRQTEKMMYDFNDQEKILYKNVSNA